MELSDLYRQKGELLTTIEIAQAKLQVVNQQIVQHFNEAQQATMNGTKKVEDMVIVEQPSS